ncbi:MAG: dihydropteroate synthase [Bacteroidaceae bacterium]|nr:dihydropteroate synthase [Bacteroidaceae bacterium]
MKQLSEISTHIMGIINVTPDSFYKDSRVTDADAVLKQIKAMVADGADAIDIGACSTRPGFENIGADNELQRLKDVVPVVREAFPDLLLSVDTFHPQVAETCLKEWNVDIINDISGGCAEMYRIVATYGAAYVLTYNEPVRENVETEMVEFFRQKCAELSNIGIKKLILDPGFGFSKTLEQNYRAFACIEKLQGTGYETMVGISRKSMIYKILHNTPQEALNGTTVLHTLAIQQNASWLRVHDVREAAETVQIMKFFKNI